MKLKIYVFLLLLTTFLVIIWSHNVLRTLCNNFQKSSMWTMPFITRKWVKTAIFQVIQAYILSHKNHANLRIFGKVQTFSCRLDLQLSIYKRVDTDHNFFRWFLVWDIEQLFNFLSNGRGITRSLADWLRKIATIREFCFAYITSKLDTLNMAIAAGYQQVIRAYFPKFWVRKTFLNFWSRKHVITTLYVALCRDWYKLVL